MNPTPAPTPTDQPADDYSQPVAYDNQGRPLYAHPPRVTPSPMRDVPEEYEGENFDPRLRKQYAIEPDLVHARRELEPPTRPISTELEALHQASAARYPLLNLSEGEHVILAVKRHPIGLLLPVGVAGLIIVVLLSVLFSYPLLLRDGLQGLPPVRVVVIPALLLIALVALGGFITAWVYLQNKFYMTNESVIQELQLSLFSRHEQTVSLGSIEDASFRQSGILQLIFNYGSIRLSTEGEETTYRFYFVQNPKQQIAMLNNAVESFKNGRPVTSQTISK